MELNLLYLGILNTGNSKHIWIRKWLKLMTRLVCGWRLQKVTSDRKLHHSLLR